MQNLSVQSVTQFSATLDNVPGSIAKVSGALAASGVSVVGFSQMPESGGRVRFVVDQPAAAIAAASVSWIPIASSRRVREKIWT